MRTWHRCKDASTQREQDLKQIASNERKSFALQQQIDELRTRIEAADGHEWEFLKD